MTEHLTPQLAPVGAVTPDGHKRHCQFVNGMDTGAHRWRSEDDGVGLRVLNLGGETVDSKSATGKLILTIFAGFAQFEREMMLERQREGIAKAKARTAIWAQALSAAQE